jgi:hypothetical protein
MENKIVSVERARLAPFVERVNGGEMRESFRDAFERAAGRYMLGRIEAREFRGITGELIRDAAGTAAQQDRDAGTAKLWGTAETSGKRSRWAVWPTDGSARLNVAERVVYAVTGAVSVVVLVWLGFLMAGVLGTSPDAPALNIPTATVADKRDADMLTRGASWSWSAYTECGNGPASCDAVLAEVNREARAYGLHVWEDGSVSPLDN